MSDSETPADSAARTLKERISQAFLAYEPRQVFKHLADAEASHKPFLLLGTSIHLFTVLHDRVTYEMRTRQSLTSKDKRDPDLWLLTNPADIHYGPDVLESALFGQTENDRLVSRNFNLNRDSIDLSDLFFALGGKMGNIQDIEAFTDDRFGAILKKRGYTPYTALAMHIPEQISVDPCRAEIVLAIKFPVPDNCRLRPEPGVDTHPPLFNRSRNYRVLPNPIDEKHPRSLRACEPSALYVSAPAHKLT